MGCEYYRQIRRSEFDPTKGVKTFQVPRLRHRRRPSLALTPPVFDRYSIKTEKAGPVTEDQNHTGFEGNIKMKKFSKSHRSSKCLLMLWF